MIQKFLVEEATELIYDSDKIEEWKTKCEELGLVQQIALANGDKSPIPFECMNTVSERVYETLCPTKVNYKTYHKTAIPLEVLSLIALAEKEKYFEKIEIWHDDKTPDPLAVGYVKEGAYSYKKYAIARWGDVLRPFEELKSTAIRVYQNSKIIELRKKIADYNRMLEDITINTERYFDAQAQSYDVSGF